MLTQKQMLQRLPIALAQVKASDAFESISNEIHKTICCLQREKQITEKVYNNIMNSIKL